jgi:hypothetical protein
MSRVQRRHSQAQPGEGMAYRSKGKAESGVAKRGYCIATMGDAAQSLCRKAKAWFSLTMRRHSQTLLCQARVS